MAQAFRSALKHPNFWFGMGLLWTGIIIYGCFAPSQPDVGVTGFDKLLHGGAFAGLAFWFGAVYAKQRHLFIVLSLAFLGIVIEIGQGLTSYRSSDMLDFVADSMGIVIGITLAKTRLAHALRYIEARVSPARP